MKLTKYLLIALVAITMVSCGEDEPTNTFTRDFTMIFPQHTAGHKMISKIERKYTNGALSVATANYDGDHLKSVNVVNRDKYGDLLNEETIHFDYNNGAIFCDKSIQDVTYSFEVNSLGAITRLKNETTSRTAASLTYSNNNEIEIAQIISPSSSDVTKVVWDSGKLMNWVSTGVNKKDSVAYEYGEGAPLNKGGIDIVANDSFTFTVFVCAIMRNAGLFGATSAYLPTAFKKAIDYSQEGGGSQTEDSQLKRYDISYVLDSEGYVKSYTTNESPAYSVSFTYR